MSWTVRSRYTIFKKFLDVAQPSVMDNVPYTSLLYGTGGPNNYQYSVVNSTVSRDDPSVNNTRDFEYSQQSVVLTDEVTHGGSDVLVYAKGIFRLIMYLLLLFN
jgi:alkaline phosphatase